MSGNLSLVEELRRQREASARTTKPSPVQMEDSGAASAAQPATETELTEENFQAYGAYRGVRDQALHLSFQLLQGPWPPALGYAWFIGPAWVANVATEQGRGQAIILYYATGHRVHIVGRNLWPLYEKLVRHRVYRISEMGADADRFLPETETVVYQIRVEEPEGGVI